ncbi:MAG: HypC/HybG/HupF family hydrogenase formation chaperone [Candidatus Omnitrophica bacterium]|nr:HypC/HybG/HupF family hydrogenase formation chaperone [Candidatus Omnitrophota bacterium]
MCLAVPMKVKKINGAFAQVDAAGLLRQVNIEMVSGIKEGDFVLVHAGFAIQKIDKARAKETLRILYEIH